MKYVSTVEAVYYLVCSIYTKRTGKETHNFDNLLFYFKYQYDLIQAAYRNNPKKSFTSKKLDSDTYIKSIK